MPMFDTENKCPDCGKNLTDVDCLLECQHCGGHEIMVPIPNSKSYRIKWKKSLRKKP